MSQKIHLNNSSTQIHFFNCLSDIYLNELLERVENNIFKTDIENELKEMHNYQSIKDLYIKPTLKKIRKMNHPYILILN
jgi:hypothetical protein